MKLFWMLLCLAGAIVNLLFIDDTGRVYWLNALAACWFSAIYVFVALYRGAER